jgi:Protein of unknown function (DUF5818)
MLPRTLKQIAVRGLFLVAATALHACASSPTSPAEVEFSASPPGQVIKVDGVLTSEGAECPAMRADDGSVYTLLGDLKGFGPGDRIRVEGTRQEVSICMQGLTLQVTQITRR